LRSQQRILGMGKAGSGEEIKEAEKTLIPESDIQTKKRVEFAKWKTWGQN